MYTAFYDNVTYLQQSHTIGECALSCICTIVVNLFYFIVFFVYMKPFCGFISYFYWYAAIFLTLMPSHLTLVINGQPDKMWSNSEINNEFMFSTGKTTKAENLLTFRSKKKFLFFKKKKHPNKSLKSRNDLIIECMMIHAEKGIVTTPKIILSIKV